MTSVLIWEGTAAKEYQTQVGVKEKIKILIFVHEHYKVATNYKLSSKLKIIIN